MSEDSVHPSGIGKIVCVTGASGFIGSHLVKQLAGKGYAVHATVRNAQDVARYGWVTQLAEGTAGSVQLFSADLLKPGSFDEAMQGCEFVCHVAAVVEWASADPEGDIVQPAVDGTRNVLSSVLKARAAKRVVVTSTILAICDWHKAPGHTFTEADWNTGASQGNPYARGKTLAEREAWRVCGEQQERAARGEDGGWSFSLVTLQPGLVLGNILHEAHANSSVQFVLEMLCGSLPLAPPFSWPMVHVRDVALAHLLALEDSAACGRYIVAESGITSMLELSHILKSEYPGCRAPSWGMPEWLLPLVAAIHPKLSVVAVRENSGKHFYSNKRAVEELGMTFRSAREAILDTAESLITFGLVPPLK